MWDTGVKDAGNTRKNYPNREFNSSDQTNLLEGEKDLSTAIDHLLSIKSVTASNVAGQASAVKRVPNTVIIAPCFINPIAISTPSSHNVNTLKNLSSDQILNNNSSHGIQTNYLK